MFQRIPLNGLAMFLCRFTDSTLTEIGIHVILYEKSSAKKIWKWHMELKLR